MCGRQPPQPVPRARALAHLVDGVERRGRARRPRTSARGDDVAGADELVGLRVLGAPPAAPARRAARRGPRRRSRSARAGAARRARSPSSVAPDQPAVAQHELAVARRGASRARSPPRAVAGSAASPAQKRSMPATFSVVAGTAPWKAAGRPPMRGAGRPAPARAAAPTGRRRRPRCSAHSPTAHTPGALVRSSSSTSIAARDLQAGVAGERRRRAGCRWRRRPVGVERRRRRPARPPRRAPSPAIARSVAPQRTSMPERARSRRSSSRAPSASSCSSISRSARCTTRDVAAALAQPARRLQPQQPAADHDRAARARRRAAGCARMSASERNARTPRGSRPGDRRQPRREPVASTSASYAAAGRRPSSSTVRARERRARAPRRRRAASTPRSANQRAGAARVGRARSPGEQPGTAGRGCRAASASRADAA